MTSSFREAVKVAEKKPTTLISDGASNFHEAWKEVKETEMR